MNVSKIIVIGLMAAALPALAEIKIGDTRQQVVADLGTPDGEIVAGTYQLLTFERGKVELRDGKVSKIELISEAVAEKNRVLREQQQAAAEKAATAARLNRIAEGTTIRKAKLEDHAFMLSPASDRVAYWQSFSKLYPEVVLDTEYTGALKELEQQLALQRVEQERQNAVSALEQRVADAEARAVEAERRQSRVFTDVSYAPAYVAYPYWSHRRTPIDCPPSAPSTLPQNSVPFHNPYLPERRSWVSSPFLYDNDCSPYGVSAGYRSPGISIQFNGR